MTDEVVEKPEAPPSLRDTLESVIETGAAEPSGTPGKGEGSDPPPKAAPQAAEPPPQASEPPPEDEPSATTPQAKEKPDAEDKQQPTEVDKLSRAPKSWKPDARAKWETTDPAIRAEVVRREREVQRALSESSGAREFTQSFKEIAGPFSQRYHQAGLQPLQVVKNMMEVDHTLAYAPAHVKAKLMAKLIKDYDIDIGLLDTAISGGDSGEEPVSIVERMIEKKLAPINEYFQTSQQREHQRTQAEMEAQRQAIENMAEDEDNFPYFETVRQDMADIIEMNARRGVYLDPKTAYTRAVAMNPDAQAAEQERAKQRTAQRANNAATRALGASLSVNGSPAGLRTTVSPADLRGTLEAAWAEANGR